MISDESDIEVLIEEHIVLEKLKQVSGTKCNDYNRSQNGSEIEEEEISSSSKKENGNVAELMVLKTKIEEAMQINLKMREELLALEKNLMQKHRESCDRKQEQTKELSLNDMAKMKFFTLPSERFFDKFRSPYFKFNGSAAPLNIESDKLSTTSLPFQVELDEWNSSNVNSVALAVRKYLLIESVTKKQPGNDKPISKSFFKSREFIKLKQTLLYDLVKDRDDGSMDWNEIINYVRKPATAKECRQLWSLHIRPSLRDWSETEQAKMLEIAKAHNLQDWDVIAKELNTDRTGYECFYHHQNTITLDCNDGKWSKEEESHLNNVIEKVKIGDYISWDKVSYFLDSKFVEQIYAKWHGFQAPHITRGHFTEREDRILLGMIHKFGADMKSVAAILKNRSMAQLTARYKDHLLPQISLKVGEWTFEEDEKLLNLVEEHGETKWAVIAKHFKTRSRVQIRHRYKLLKQKITENPDINLKSIYRPKRPTSKKRASKNRTFFKKVITANGKHVKSLLRKAEPKPGKRAKTVDKKLTQYFQMKFKTQKINESVFPKRYNERNDSTAACSSHQSNDYLSQSGNQLSSALLFSSICLRNMYEAGVTDDWSPKDRSTFCKGILDLWVSSKNARNDLIKWHSVFCSLFAAPILLSHLELDKWKHYTEDTGGV